WRGQRNARKRRTAGKRRNRVHLNRAAGANSCLAPAIAPARSQRSINHDRYEQNSVERNGHPYRSAQALTAVEVERVSCSAHNARSGGTPSRAAGEARPKSLLFLVSSRTLLFLPFSIIRFHLVS